jgi:transposase-like protein
MFGKDDQVATNAPPDPEVEARPRRRRFTAKYKLEVLSKADACKNEPGEIGELLRREGLYSSHLTEWRRQRDEGALAALGRKRGRKPNPDSELIRENERLRRELARLQKRLDRAEVIIDVQKKVSALLGIPLSAPDSDESGS